MSETSVGTIVKTSLGWSIALSVLMIICGLLAVALPQLGGIAVSLLIAWLLLFVGATHFLFGWHARSAGGIAWHIFLQNSLISLSARIFWFGRSPDWQRLP